MKVELFLIWLIICLVWSGDSNIDGLYDQNWFQHVFFEGVVILLHFVLTLFWNLSLNWHNAQTATDVESMIFYCTFEVKVKWVQEGICFNYFKIFSLFSIFSWTASFISCILPVYAITTYIHEEVMAGM